MLSERLLDATGPRVDAAHGTHETSSKYPRAVFATRPGTLMAASSWPERVPGCHLFPDPTPSR